MLRKRKRAFIQRTIAGEQPRALPYAVGTTGAFFFICFFHAPDVLLVIFSFPFFVNNRKRVNVELAYTVPTFQNTGFNNTPNLVQHLMYSYWNSIYLKCGANTSKMLKFKKSKTYNHKGTQIVRKIPKDMMVQTESKLNARIERKNSLKFEWNLLEIQRVGQFSTSSAYHSQFLGQWVPTSTRSFGRPRHPQNVNSSVG